MIDPLVYYTKLDEEGIENFSLKKINESLFFYMQEVYLEVSDNFRQKFNFLIEKEQSFIGCFNYIDQNKIRLLNIVK